MCTRKSLWRLPLRLLCLQIQTRGHKGSETAHTATHLHLPHKQGSVGRGGAQGASCRVHHPRVNLCVRWGHSICDEAPLRAHGCVRAFATRTSHTRCACVLRCVCARTPCLSGARARVSTMCAQSCSTPCATGIPTQSASASPYTSSARFVSLLHVTHANTHIASTRTSARAHKTQARGRARVFGALRAVASQAVGPLDLLLATPVSVCVCVCVYVCCALCVWQGEMCGACRGIEHACNACVCSRECV